MLLLKSHWPYLGPIDNVPGHESLGLGLVCLFFNLCYLCIVFVMLLRLFIAALWLLVGNGLTSWLSFVVINCIFFTFPCEIVGKVWYLIQFRTKEEGLGATPPPPTKRP